METLKRCADCGKPAIVYVGRGWRADTLIPESVPYTDNQRKYAATLYCPSCGERHKQESNAWRQARFRARKRREEGRFRRIAEEQAKRIKEAGELLLKYQKEIMDLQDALESCKVVQYERGRFDERRTLVGRVLRRVGGEAGAD